MKIFDGDVFRQYLLKYRNNIAQVCSEDRAAADTENMPYAAGAATVREMITCDVINHVLSQLDSAEVEVHQVPKGGAVLLRINNNYNMAEFCEYWDTIKDSFISADVQAVAISDAAYKIDTYSNLDDMITDIENLLKYLKDAKETKDATEK